MKTEKIYSWILRISNPSTGEAETLRFNNRDLYVSIFKLHKNALEILLDKKFPVWISCTEARANF